MRDVVGGWSRDATREWKANASVRLEVPVPRNYQKTKQTNKCRTEHRERVD